LLERAGDDVLGRLVKLLRERVVPGIRPDLEEVLIRTPAEQDAAAARHPLLSPGHHDLVHVLAGPAAVREPAPVVLAGPARRLHHAVERHVLERNDLAHRVSSLPFFTSTRTDPALIDTLLLTRFRF